MYHYKYAVSLSKTEVSLFLCFGGVCTSITKEQYEF